MVVTCQMVQCPYYDKSGFCTNELVNIDENGMCSILWRRGQRKMPPSQFDCQKNKIIIENAEFKIIKNQEEEVKEVKAETSQEDLTNGDAAL